jgi:formate hydrogenlyase subunit 3/multisubunit Na+/H+ antiporter MnhD subunit
VVEVVAPVTHAAPMLVVAWPLAAAALLALAAAAPRARLLAPLRAARGAHALVVATAVGVTLALAAAVPAVLEHGALEVVVPALLGALRFRLDALGLTVALLAGVVWSASSLHASAYLAGEPTARTLRYHLTSLVTFAALLTVVSAADLITLYLGFEWLGLAAYLFVVHTGSKAAEAAGVKYLVLTLAGGFAVLTGALLVHALGGGDLAAPLALDPERSTLRAVAAACLLVGFGVKAGALGLHTWLPDAHTAAPAPASALLSGVMLKAGAYGIARTLSGPFGADTGAGLAALQQAETLGLVVLWWGVATMLVGVVVALMQRHAKRLLAYSSVSQMGFVLAGVGAAVYLGEAGAIGWTGAMAHVVNHGLFKALLFLGVGAVITSAGSGELASLGGLARRMPWTFALVLVGVAGIVGMPLLNGFVSKSVIHHAIDYAAAEGRGHGLAVAERLFVLTTVGTAAALMKLTAAVFLGRPGSDGARDAVEAPFVMRLALLPLGLAVVALGLRPQLLAPLVGSTLQAWGLPSVSVERWLTSPVARTCRTSRRRRWRWPRASPCTWLRAASACTNARSRPGRRSTGLRSPWRAPFAAPWRGRSGPATRSRRERATPGRTRGRRTAARRRRSRGSSGASPPPCRLVPRARERRPTPKARPATPPGGRLACGRGATRWPPWPNTSTGAGDSRSRVGGWRTTIASASRASPGPGSSVTAATSAWRWRSWSWCGWSCSPASPARARADAAAAPPDLAVAPAPLLDCRFWSAALVAGAP